VTSHVSASEEDTRSLGATLARSLSPGDVVLLEGELGAGKTAFVKGLAAGLGLDPEDVSSPSFELVHEYGPAGKPPVLVHVDLYRLPDGSAPLLDLGLDECGSATLAVEWPRPPLTERRAWRVALRIEPDGSRTIELREPVQAQSPLV
jgi:tRNA threonylcarbamoyladenosine biosynthesis protein TsaE